VSLDATELVLYCSAVLALLVVPGPSVLYIVTRSIDQGRRAGLVSVLGIHLGTIVHITAAAIGVSALIVSSATAYNTLRIAGAAYLIFIGVSRLLSKKNGDGEPNLEQARSLRKIFFQGALVNTLNPKTALFFFAFLPQFVDRTEGSVPLQVTVLGGIFVLLGILSDGTYALLASGARERLLGSRTFLRLHNYVSGVVYIALGAAAAFAGGDARSNG
jgi:threonine/homoserine/homoserine lactone efflux protein